MQFGDAPLPASLNYDEPIGKIGGCNADRVTRITHHKGEAPFGGINHAPTTLVGNRDAFTTKDERAVVFILKDLRRIDAPLDGEIRRLISTKCGELERFGGGDR